MSNVEHVIKPQAKDLGDNFEVRRALPHIKKKMVGPFIFWDHMGPVTLGGSKDMTVRAHPHIGLATITWLFSGEIMHRDSLGNEQAIKPGGVNWMTAGNGITHSERAKAKGDSMLLEGIQLWLALPKDKEDIDPSFYHCEEEDVPMIEEKGCSLRLIAGEAFGLRSPVPVYSDLFYLNGEATQGYEFHFPLKENAEGAIYVVSGQLQSGEETFERFDLITFKQGTSLDFKVLEDAKFMVFGGEVFPEKRTVWWNFVSTSKEKIEQAKERWRADEFPKVINEVERIPLPGDE